MIASVETDVFALDLAPAAKLGRDSLFLSPAYRFLSPDRMTAPNAAAPKIFFPLLLRQLQHRREVWHLAGRGQVGRCRCR